MKRMLVPIGNSQGIRIPKVLLEQCGIEQCVELEPKGRMLIIRPCDVKPREGWEETFRAMHQRQEDRVLLHESLDLGVEGWEW